MDVLQSKSGISEINRLGDVSRCFNPPAELAEISTNVRQTFSRGISETRNTSKRKSGRTNLRVGSRVTGIWHFGGIVQFSLRYRWSLGIKLGPRGI